MADKMIRSNYVSMIESLTNFSTRVSAISANMQESVSACRQALGQEDSGIQHICAQVQQAQEAYAQLAQSARSLKDQIEEELNQMDREGAIWDDD